MVIRNVGIKESSHEKESGCQSASFFQADKPTGKKSA